ncbi:hypothetical protein [Halorubrum vacuolatum]|uniref:hypothetical protein n=1 Tax=Halorubrum vacuolatum TaxID=63740 RepID=UPI00117A1610|nr:hypothetical protein [Halorubrum vacuolatum]
MSDSDGGWHYAGEANVSSEGRVSLPERLFEESILHPDQVAYWSYEIGVGFLLVSNQPLKRDIYKTQKNSDIGDAPGYRTTIPKKFFSASLNPQKASGFIV